MKLKPYQIALKPFVERLGFHRTGRLWTIDLAPNAIGILGMNEVRYPGELFVNPIMGVRFQDVQRIVAECCGRRFDPTNPMTVFEPLGYLMPEKRYKQWPFTRDHLDEAAQDMATAIETYGLPFMRFGKTLLDYRRAHKGHCIYWAYTEPVAAFLAGDREQALALLEKAEAAVAAGKAVTTGEFESFAQTFREQYLSNA
jgi:hypothetical protein